MIIASGGIVICVLTNNPSFDHGSNERRVTRTNSYAFRVPFTVLKKRTLAHKNSLKSLVTVIHVCWVDC